MQEPESYNLTQIMDQMKASGIRAISRRGERDVTGRASQLGRPPLWFPNRFVPRPLWVISGHTARSRASPLYPRLCCETILSVRCRNFDSRLD